MLDNAFEEAINTPQNRLNLELASLGFHVVHTNSICGGCKLAEPHPEYPAWYKCVDSVSNPGGEWPAVFDGEVPVACARKE
ncbi:MAG: hypothetical protein ACYSW3_02205 [Planctomycetota bacterium]|jgi:hypothetical protein